MNKADWLTAAAAIVGVVGIGFGLWWLDAVAAALISLDITKDGVSNLRRAVVDLMDQTPTTIDEDDADRCAIGSPRCSRTSTGGSTIWR